MRKFQVTASKEYEVWVGPGLLAQAGALTAAACGGAAAMLVSDDTVNRLYGAAAGRSLEEAGYTVHRFVFPHGERAKNMETYLSLLRALAQARLSRADVVVALGGGVTGDLAGFAAATYLRGINIVQLPTTLLAMVDSSVGGKTAVDLPEGKNLAGAFHQPSLVLCDIELLQSLEEEVFQDGCAEMIKHGVILSAELFALLREPLSLEDIVARNIALKRDVVAQDERENGLRRILNFGHTIGHAIEKHSNYQVRHGQAVAVGMVLASRGAWRMGLCAGECHQAILEMVRHYHLPCHTAVTPEQLAAAAAFDKKRGERGVSLILPEEIGRVTIKDFTPDELAAFIRLAMAA